MRHGAHEHLGHAPVAQLDRAPDYESGGQEFESLRARQKALKLLVFLRLTHAALPGAVAVEAMWKRQRNIFVHS